VNKTKNWAVNNLLMRVARRAELYAPEYVARTFVPVEPIPTLLNALDNQVLYGRRGTGKTHLLRYFAEIKAAEGDVALYIDLRMIGSSSGLYADSSQPLTLRATNLLVDIVEHVHNQLYRLLDTDAFSDMLDGIIPSLDAIGQAATEVKVVGHSENAVAIDEGMEDSDEGGIALGIKGALPSVTARGGSRRKRSRHLTESRRQ
jgi:hypothetical protein